MKYMLRWGSLRRRFVRNLWSLWCPLAGHRPYEGSLFSARMGICKRCGYLPPFTKSV